jgi:hypothetical protein
MNASATVIASSLLGFGSVILGDEPKFPPPEMNFKEPWTTLEKKH